MDLRRARSTPRWPPRALIPLFLPTRDFAAKTSRLATPRPQRRFNGPMIRPAK
jgi:hypothetical protein